MEIDNTKLRSDHLLGFQYVDGDDRPYIVDVLGKLVEEKETTNHRRLICLDVHRINKTDLHTQSFMWFWVERIVSGTVNNIKKGN